MMAGVVDTLWKFDDLCDAVMLVRWLKEKTSNQDTTPVRTHRISI
jgi:hypothetical protein